jgi:hypothetical protein
MVTSKINDYLKIFFKVHVANKFEVITILIVSLSIQGLVFGKFLDNSIINSYLPFYTDAEEYVEHSNVWAQKSFDEAFKNLWRMPGYPAFLQVIKFLSPHEPFLTVRIIQSLGTSSAVVILFFILRKYSTKKHAFIFCLLYCFVPTWYFSFGLIPESLTYFTIVLIIYVLSKLSRYNFKLILVIGLLLSILIYLKPNNILIIIPVIIFIIASLKGSIKKSIISLLVIILLTLLPWIVYSNAGERKLYGLTTTQGINLYVGTGMVLTYDDSALANSAVNWKVDPRNNPKDIVNTKSFNSMIESNQYLTEKALGIWKTRPLQQIGYSFDKILIAFGFKVNFISNYLLGVFTAFALVGSILLYKIRPLMAWGVTTLTIFIVLAIQAAIFQADRRFVLTVFPQFGLLSISLAYSNLVIKNRIFNLIRLFFKI